MCSTSPGRAPGAAAGGAAADGGDRPRIVGCPGCGVVAEPRGRRVRRLHDVPAFGAPVRVVVAAAALPVRRAGLPGRRVQRGPCPGRTAGEADQPGGVVGDQLHPTRQRLGRRGGPAARGGLAHRVGRRSSRCWPSWPTTPHRFDGVAVIGVDEHVVRHEALLFRMEVRDLDRFAVAAAG